MNVFIDALRRLWAAIVALFKRAPTETLFHAAQVQDFPDNPEPWKIYLAGDPNNLWGAALICPCGCGDLVELNLLRQARPCWEANVHEDRTVTLEPSVWRTKGCGSHFFVRGGRVEWC